MKMLKFLMSAAAIACGTVAQSETVVPAVSVTSVSQDSSRAVTVTYRLTGAPAVITLDVYTNGVPLEQKYVWPISGDGNRVVQPGETPRTLVWNPDKGWPNQKFGEGVVSLGVTAWATNDPPQYMAVNLLDRTDVRYYTCAEAVPGGVTNNAIYKTDVLLLRRVYAKGIPWTMGSPTDEPGHWTANDREKAHQVTLSHDYYVGVFPVTQKQWWNVMGTKPSYFTNFAYWDKRPVETVDFARVRMSGDGTATANRWPNAPGSTSFLGILRADTGIAFDLPGGAQWEYACRAGNGAYKWGDGSPLSEHMSITTGSDNDPNMNRLGRNAYNGGTVGNVDRGQAPADSTDACGTPTVGSYAPNSWGIYDMHGGVWEICLDSSTSDGSNYGDTIYRSAQDCTVRGGCFQRGAQPARSSYVAQQGETEASFNTGFRLFVTLD